MIDIDLEKAAFETWWKERCLATWRSSLAANESLPVPEHWGDGLKSYNWEGWQARAAIPPVPADADENAPWLTLAHIICADAGIPAGHIHDRLKALCDKLDAPASAEWQAEEVLAKLLDTLKKADGSLMARVIDKRLTAEEYQAVFFDAMGAVRGSIIILSRPRSVAAVPRQAAVADAQPVEIESAMSDTESARKFVDAWHRKHFPTDRTFSRYILAQGDRSNKLAGDFVWQLAKALEQVESKLKRADGEAR